MIVDYSAIPQEMKSVRRWMLWIYDTRDGELTKVPINPNTCTEPYAEPWQKRGSTTKPATWSDFERCRVIIESNPDRQLGLGFVLGDGFVGVDFDKVYRDGELAPWAAEHLETLETYSEISPSGTGVKAFGKGSKPGSRCKKKYEDGTMIEIYDDARFFTVTGNVLPPYTQFSDEVDVAFVYEEVFREEVEQKSTLPTEPATREDAEIIRLAESARNGDKFRRLFRDGDLSDFNGDSSSADQALTNLLTFYTRDPEQLGRLVSHSALDRAKWDRADYRKRTIDNALATVTEKYTPPATAETPYTEAEVMEFIARSKTAKQPAPAAPEVEVAPRFDPWTAYLWQGWHGKASGITDAHRMARVESINEVKRYMPEGGFFWHHLRGVLPTTDAPPVFHLGAALAVASLAVNRKVRLVHSDPVYPVLWVALIGPSTTARKSSSMNKAVAVVRATDLGDCLLPAAFSKEYLFDLLGFRGGPGESMAAIRKKMRDHAETCRTNNVENLQGVGLWHADELGSLLEMLNANYNKGAKEMLTEWYGVPATYSSGTKSAGSYLIDRVYVPIVAGSTPVWISKTSKEEDLESGFFPRWLWCYSAEGDYDLSIPDPGDEKAAQDALDAFQRLRAVEGDVRLSDAAAEFFDQWYYELTDSVQAPQLKSWVRRLTTNALKVATLYQCDMGGGDEVTEHAMTLASRLVTKTARDLETLINTDLSFSDEERKMKKVINQITAHPGINRSRLMSNLRPMYKRDLDPILDTLCESGQIVKHENGTTRYYPASNLGS